MGGVRRGDTTALGIATHWGLVEMGKEGRKEGKKVLSGVLGGKEECVRDVWGVLEVCCERVVLLRQRHTNTFSINVKGFNVLFWFCFPFSCAITHMDRIGV